ncbi:MBL fold metallo-hydrolase [Pelagibacterium xiamenense]|uniref:MBL fold metallo-hydrolase n=1 Tax=Pelagibacterium xiamenense TaxID=2901140 RepID=UPI001E5722F2|nr:MBL fold metallo-hydrolase [Pelagibacterium xiamenense]MCD7061437.1 MBL fold metallo-hydrolase [Pelagibacterium xiamenense]
MYDRDTVETAAGALTIIPIHHATLALEWNGKTVFCDPVGAIDRYKHFAEPDLIVLTHHHQDHFDLHTLDALVGDDVRLVAPQVVYDQLPSDIAGKTTLLANGDTAEIAGIGMRAIPMYNTTPDRLKYHEKGVGNGYLFDFAGTTVYLASDTEPTEDMRHLGRVDVAFFPMNLPFTMTPDQVVECIGRVKPAIAYPFHYRFPFDKPGFAPETLKAMLPPESETRIQVHDWYRDV